MPEGTGRAWLRQALAEFGDRPFLAHRGKTYSYAQLIETADSYGAALDDFGLRPGEAVAILSDYSFSAVAALLALYDRQSIVVPIATGSPDDVRVRLEEAFVGVTVAFGPDGTLLPERRSGPVGTHEMLERIRGQGHSGLVLFSSGSTGKPKAMIHDLDHLLDSYREKKSRQLTLLVFLMFDHIGGINTLFNALASGTKLVVPAQRLPDEVAALIAEHKVAVLPTSPTFLNLLLVSGALERHDLSSLRIITYGTEPMPEGLLLRLRDTFPKVKFLQTFGTSETGISTTTSRSSSSLEMKIEDPRVEHKVVNGELWLRSKTQVLGYLNASMERFTEDGWFRTGDLVRETGDGYMIIMGRVSEVINVGGEKVLPAEVESVLMQMPQVSDCTVFGRPNALTGQTVCAQVVLAPGADAEVFKREMRRFCREKLAPFKVPTQVSFVEQTARSDRFKKKRLPTD